VLPYNKNLKNLARNLRKNMTDAERRLWSKIRRKQLKAFQFYRQKNIGDFIVDFYCPAAKLIVEIDGGQHYSEENILKDEARDKFMSDLGFKVLRFSNSDVFNNIEGVVTEIYNHLKKIPPNPPLKKGGKG
jgi:very-short-patch-repair endonuclease